MTWRGCGGLVSALARFAQHSNVTLQTISCCFLPKNTERTLKLALVSSSAIACWRLSQNLVDSRVLLAGAYLMSGTTTTTTIMTTNLITKSSFLFPQGKFFTCFKNAIIFISSSQLKIVSCFPPFAF